MINHPESQLGETQSSMSQILATFGHSFALNDVDRSTVEKAKLHILDTLGAGIAGAASPEAIAARTALAPASVDQSPIWGTPISANPTTAAMVNGVAAHALELDDTDGCDHSGAVVLPAILSAVHSVPAASGADILRATILGYEIAHRVLDASGGYAACNGAGWHSTGTCGSFGAAAAASSMMRLPVGAFTSALGLAGSFTGGLWAFIEDGTMSKRLHAGRAAENGVVSALLAQNGYTGPSAVFEAPWGGYFSTYVPATAVPEKLISGLGLSWRISKASFKPYASCRDTHGAIDSILDLEGHKEISRISSVVVKMSEFSARMCGSKEICSALDAQMSTPYCVAAALVHGRIGLNEISSEVRDSASIREMLGRVYVEVEGAYSPEHSPRISVHYSDGSIKTVDSQEPLGSAERPMTERQLVSKFTGLAGRSLPSTQVNALIETVMNLEALPDAQNLTALLRTKELPPPLI